MTQSLTLPSPIKSADSAKKSSFKPQGLPRKSISTDITPQKLVAEVNVLYLSAIQRVKDHHHAEDLVQSCLLTAWEKRASFEGRSTLRTWLLGILRFKILDYFRAAKRTPTDHADDLLNWYETEKAVAAFDPKWERQNPVQANYQPEILAAILVCLNQLPERLRIIFTMREIDGFTVSEIAVATGTTPGSTSVMLTRARARMRKNLTRFDIRP